MPRLPANLPLDDLRNPYARYHDNQLRAALTTTDFTERQFGYSNYGYGLLGWLLATELKQPYAELMQQRVFQPLAMPTAKVQLSLPAHAGTPPALPKLARGYAINGEQVANWQFDSLAGAGAVVASIEDMAGMLKHIFATANTDPLLQLWLTPLPLNDQPAMTPGWMLTAKGWHWHAGQTAGFSSLVVFDTTQQKGLVILTNIALPVTEQGMALFADGGILASKPYAASGAYINRMSNYCKNCYYQVKAVTGAKACPFNALYWDFLARNEAQLKDLRGGEQQRAIPLDGLLGTVIDALVATSE